VNCLVDAAAVAEHLGVPKSWVREQTRNGTIPFVELGRYRRYRLEDIDAWVSARVHQPAGRPPVYRKHPVLSRFRHRQE
jgi:excisionase family DNA binding protein